MGEVDREAGGRGGETGGNMDQLRQVCVLVSLSGVRGVAVRADGVLGGR